MAKLPKLPKPPRSDAPITDDQRRLRAITEEVQALFERHQVGGVVMVASEQSAAWHQVIPSWAAIGTKPNGFVVQIRGSTPAGVERTASTLGFIGSMRDMANDLLNLYGRLFRIAREQITLMGGELEHVPFGGGSHRPDPFGGKGD